jgi:XTP/dITP diphosphohydrolase
VTLQLFFGTTNPGKLRELRRLVADLAVQVVTPDALSRPLPEVVEDGETFQANAEKKAAEWARWSGLHALADDSGLCVAALGGAPGVYSARWSELAPAPSLASPSCALAGVGAGGLSGLAPHPALPTSEVAGRPARDERNNDLLLRELAGVPEERRGAEYRAVLSLARPDGGVVASVTGVCRGRIGHARRGTGGFGYDPLFLVEGAPGGSAVPRTMAELASEEKDAISHRGEAFRRLLPILAALAAP